MIREIEVLAADAVAQEAAEDGAHVSQASPDCLNCGARLQGRYCHVCGQSADDHHRSIGHLMWEAVEGFTHLDGRLAKTLPALLFHPGQLARDHFEGRRQRHVPPFRLFLVTLLVFMFSAEAALHLHDAATRTVHTASTDTRTYRTQGGSKVVVVTGMSGLKTELDKEPSHSAFEVWLRDHLGRAMNNREYYQMLVFEWAHRLAVLMLPILAGFLTLAYVYKKQFYIYDHLVVAMQYLSFCFLIWAPMWASPKWLADWIFPVALIWTPLNLYLILRTAYGSSRLGAGIKAIVLWLATVVAFSLLLTGLLAYALNRM